MVGLLPLPFSANAPQNIWTNIAYAFTTSASPYSSMVIFIGMSVYYSFRRNTPIDKIKKFTSSLFCLVIVFGIAAWLNENYIKSLYKFPRPSHQYILFASKTSTPLDSVYALDKNQRTLFFQKKITDNPNQFKQIDAKIRSHWVQEAGLSFPSGHSFNAFLVAMIFGYAIYNNNQSSHWKNLFLIPFIWALMVAVSRVAIGAHTALDVSGGAAMGILLGLSLLYHYKTRSFLT
jgi:phosphatidylglycerophosphatase B